MEIKKNKKLLLGGVKFVLFDWDNTLAESRTPLLYAFNIILQRHNLPSLEELQKKRNIDLSFRENFVNFFGDRANDFYEEYAEEYLRHVDRLITTFLGVKEVMNFFCSHGIKMMVMTNKDRRLLERELPLLFDPNCFERIVCGQEAKKDKPHPEHVFHTLEGYLKKDEITPDLVWVVGDSPQDSNGALAANALPIRIGKDIWHQVETVSEKIIYFDSFEAFYKGLSEEN